MAENPYLSVVIVCRNDNYGGDFLTRLQLFVHNQIKLWAKYRLRAELVVVEWNPPPDRPRIKNVIDWPRNEYASVRIIGVSSKVHQKIAKGNKSPLFEFFGKNVGVRRASGEYVLVTNPDLLYSEELVAFFASRQLDENSFYRIDRHDFKGADISLTVDTKTQLRLASEHVYAVNNSYGSAFLVGERFLSLRKLIRMLTRIKNVAVHFPSPPLYVNAGGDFFLMHNKKWKLLRGYPEINFGLCDAILYNAASLGLKQIILKWPMAIFHAEHDHQGGARVPSDLEIRKRQYLKMLHQQKPWIPNDESWGLGGMHLPEDRIL